MPGPWIRSVGWMPPFGQSSVGTAKYISMCNELITAIGNAGNAGPPSALEQGRQAEDRNVRSRLVAIALDGLRAHAGEVLPGRPPSRSRYVNRWSPRS